MFFDTWLEFGRIAISGVLAYSALIICLLISGKRTLSKWNSFDFVVTIALGSLLAAVVTSKELALTEGVFAFSFLIFLQFVITWLSVRIDWIKNLIKAEPTRLFDSGEFLHDAMKRERVTESEILAAMRSNGLASIGEIEAVVLETNGEFSVLKKSADGSRSALRNVS